MEEINLIDELQRITDNAERYWYAIIRKDASRIGKGFESTPLTAKHAEVMRTLYLFVKASQDFLEAVSK